jgi:predicted histone-like DNA-binding protein
MKYKFVQRANPQNRNVTKYYATPAYDGSIEMPEIADEIVQSSSLSRGDVTSTVENVIDVIPKYLKMGKSISLGELGTLRVGFTSEGVDSPDKFHTSMITGKKIIFTPSPKLKRVLAELHFEQDAKAKENSGGNGGDGGDEEEEFGKRKTP